MTGKESAPADTYRSPFSSTTSRPDWNTYTQACYGAAGTSSSSYPFSKALNQFISNPLQQRALYHHQRGLYTNPNGVPSNKESTSLHIRENNDANGKKDSKKRNYDKFIADGKLMNLNACIGADARDKGTAEYPNTNPVSTSKSNISSNTGMSLDAEGCTGPLPLEAGPSASGISSLPVASPFADEPQEAATLEKQFQDEEEKKKQLKRLANRESARRSRERKNHEYKKLEAEVERIREENAKLANFMKTLSKGCMKFVEENNSLMKELTENYGEGAIADLLAKDPNNPV